MEARVNTQWPFRTIQALAGQEFIKGEWRPVSSGFEEEAKKHPYLDVREPQANPPEKTAEELAAEEAAKAAKAAEKAAKAAEEKAKKAAKAEAEKAAKAAKIAKAKAEADKKAAKTASVSVSVETVKSLDAEGGKK